MKENKLFDIESNLEEKLVEIEEKNIEKNFDVDMQIRRAMKKAIKQCPKSRIIIAAEMSELVGVQISEYMLNNWVAGSKNDYKIPASYIPAFCQVTGDISCLKIISNPLGVKVVENRDILWLKYAKIREYEKMIKAQKKMLEKRLKEK